MSFHSWLQNLRSALAPRPSQRHYGRQCPPRAVMLRPGLEVLEDRFTPTFSPAASFPVGSIPQAVVTGDFNGDGQPDLAMANPGFHSVSVLLGDGGGGFSAAINSAGTNNSYGDASIAVADFNNDGHMDLATAMSVYFYDGTASGRLDVWLGNGDGTFQPPASVPSLLPLAVEAGDFNNDGNSDLVVSTETENYGYGYGYVQISLGNGQGGFGGARSVYGGLYGDLAAGDFNDDGNLDAVGVAEGSSWGAAFLGDGAGGLFGETTFYSTNYWLPVRAVAVGDFNGDSLPDLVVSGGAVEIFTGFGDGTFGEPVAHSANGSEQTGVAVADFNGDGRLDAVTSDADTGTVSELQGNGNGTLTYAGAYTVGSSPSGIAVGDFNGDGRPDVATADADSNMASVLLNDGTWTPPPPPPAPPPALRIGDRTVTEGNTETRTATFTVTLSAPSTRPVTVAYATGNGTATAGTDYQAVSGTLTFAPGETAKTLTVQVLGDHRGEPNETFVVNLGGPTDATIADGQGVGTITDDEPRIGISDVTKSEGKKNQATLFTFTVSLSAAYDQPVTVSFRTANGTATTGDNDYVARTGMLTFAPGETTKTITIEVKGDNKKEADETFYLDLFGLSSNALFTKNRGLGTILNDD
jgi:hypothetical protein